MTILEIAVYIAVLSGASPMVCHLQDSETTRCSNGYLAKALSATTVRFSDGITVHREGNAFPSFSNGLKASLGLDGSLQFSNGMVLRRTAGSYIFSNGLTCRTELPDLINCVRAPS
jgi:hypothetical protein